ncbi:MAG: ribosome-binding factor A [Patescibacteria group bacterium]
MISRKDERMLSAVGEAAAEFVNRVSVGESLVTVTKVEYRDNTRTINIFVSVLPPESTGKALALLKRERREFSSFLKRRITTRVLPPTQFMADPAMGTSTETGSA